MPRPGQVLGLVGSNGTGKSTALKILAGKLKPNLGRYASPPDWQDILTYYRGSELQNFFTRVLEDEIKALIKPQYVDSIPKAVKGKVGAIVAAKDDRKVAQSVLHDLGACSSASFLYMAFFLYMGYMVRVNVCIRSL